MCMVKLDMIYGGNGAHWVGCEEVHYDCAITKLNQRLQELERALLEAGELHLADESTIYQLEYGATR